VEADPLLRDLNPEQREAVLSGDGPLLVLAGAGSGKTRVVTRRLARLVAEGADPRRLVAVTFTNKAAEEMRERVAALLGGRLDSFVGTFHSWGLRFLRRIGGADGRTARFSIADTADQFAFVREAMEELGLSEQTFPPGSVHGRISSAKGAVRSAEKFAGEETDFAGSRIAEVYSRYEKKLRAANAFDFDDLITVPVRLLKGSDELRDRERARIEHLLVDEYQDTNTAQDALIKLLGDRARSLCAVGDEDQSIYAWRGARVEHILRFEEDFPGARVVALTRNYRSTGRILEAAASVVSHNRRRRPKALVSDGAAGLPVEVRTFRDDRGEAESVVSEVLRAERPLSEFAILFRVNAQSRSFEDELMRRNVPYIVIGGMKFYERAEVKDAVAYYRLALDPRDDLAFRRVVNVPARGIGGVTMDRLAATAREKGISLFEASQQAAGVTERARIALERFRATVAAAQAKAEELGPSALLDFVLEASGYRAMYSSSQERDDVARRENLTELLSAAREYERREGEVATNRGFLDAVALATDADAPRPSGAVTLMTLHSAKGLEFSDVYVAGLEEGFLPHMQSAGSEDEIEEERRLLYVGMTRARKRLVITLARQRMLYGEIRARQPSRFLEELPGDVARIDLGGYPSSLFDRDGDADDEDVAWETPRRPAAGPGRGVPVTVARRRAVVPGTLPGLSRGSRVRHPTYGPGVILQQEGSGDDARLTVFFDRAGKKKFVARFANLTPA
jgi:DNA helicase II / ATP-dependent DNA helicase PcrA